MSRNGDLHLTKECSEYTGEAGSFCTITASNIEEITVGSKVIYALRAADGTLDTDITLDDGSGDVANGHVVLDLAADKGVVTFAGGTGRFTGFQAHADVTTDAEQMWHWEGTYSFE